jgi:hypothetical protein
VATPDLIVQSGSSVVAGADSYVSIAEAAEFLESIGGGRLASWEADDADTEKRKAALREATQWADNRYDWVGEISTLEEGRLRWPRLGVYSRDGVLVTGTPIGLRRFVTLVALEIRTAGIETEAAAQTLVVKRERVGPLETEYWEPSRETQARVYQLAGRYLAGLVEPQRMSRRMVPR